MLRQHRRIIATAVLVGLLLGAVAAARFSPMWPGPSMPAGATHLALATEQAQLLPTISCPAAQLLPARVAVAGDALVLVPATGGDPVNVVWPAGWAAWRLDGQAELVAHDGSVVAREGDVVSDFAGGVGADGAFHVCVIGD